MHDDRNTAEGDDLPKRITPSMAEAMLDQFRRLDDDELRRQARHVTVQYGWNEQTERQLVGNLTGLIEYCLDAQLIGDARRLLIHASALGTEPRSAWFIAQIGYWMGALELHDGSPLQAAEHFKEAAAHAVDAEGKFKATVNAAESYRIGGNINQAEAQLIDGVGIAQTIGEHAGLIHCCIGLAHIAQERGVPDQGGAWLDLANTVIDGADDRDAAHLLLELGLSHQLSGKVDLAKENFALARSRAMRVTDDEQWSFRFTAAVEYNERANAARSGKRAGEVRAPMEPSEARYLAPTEAIDETLTAADVALSSGDRALAKTLIRDARRIAERTGNHLGCFRAAYKQARTYAMEGMYEPAYESCASAIVALENARANVGNESYRQEFIKDKSYAYELMVKLNVILANSKENPRFLGEAIFYVESNKARTVSEMLGLSTELPVPLNVPEDLVERERKLLQTLRRCELDLYQQAGDLETTGKQFRTAKAELDGVWKQLAELNADYVALRSGKPPSFAQIRDSLLN